MRNEERLLKLADLERELGVSRWTLYEWLKEGKISGRKLPCGHYRVPASELKRFRSRDAANRQDGER